MERPDRIVRSKRRTMSMEADSCGNIILRAPFSASEEDLERFIYSSQGWMEKAREKLSEAVARIPRVTLLDGSYLPFLGKLITLRYYPGRSIRLQGTDRGTICRGVSGPADYEPLEGAELLVPDRQFRYADISLTGRELPAELEKEQNKAMLEAWYKMQAQQYLPGRVSFYAGVMGLEVSRIRISSARTNWGSCNASKGLNFSFHTMMLGPYELDNIVVHELSHIRYRNHGKAFYGEMEKYLPDHKERDRAIRKAGWVMNILQ